METAHTVIVGSGIAGLTVAEELGKRGESVIVLEKYPFFGGRVNTHRDDGLQYEIGAGRISTQHRRVNALVKRFGLHTYPISTDSYFETRPNPFHALFDPIRRALTTADSLRHTTIAECMPETFRPILAMYPYWAEMNLMRADAALALFAPEGTMGNNAEFYGVQEGLDAITTQLAIKAQEAGADLRTRHRVHDIQHTENNMLEITGDKGKKAEATPFRIRANRVIIATCRCSLSTFSVLKGAPLLKQLQTSPLMRIYAVYPLTEEGKPWFHDIPRTITASPLRHIIPINPEKGLIMISYTDGDDTNVWRPMEGSELQTAIQNEVKALFPHKHIPEPTYLKKHDWPSGCTYWVPGEYDIHEASLAAHNPSPNVYVCGESVSTEQTWIEGALQSAEHVLTIL